MASSLISYGRRAGDGGVAAWLNRMMQPQRVDRVVLGRVLVVVAAVIVTATVPLLDKDGDAWLQVGFVALGLGACVAVSFVVPWARLSPRAALAFPIAVHAAFLMLARLDTAVFAPLTGLLALCFAYVGLTQPSRTSLALLPVAGFVLVHVNGGWTSAVAIRAVIACVVWGLLGELLSYFTSLQQTLSAALRTAAHTDVLTGVANRRDLDLRLATVTAGDMLVICDLDHFKALNDTFGHHVGDQVLAEFGTMLRATLRGSDYCARLGGEEFVLVLAATSGAESEATLARMREHWAVLRPDLTFSAGLANCTADRPHVETLAAADRALYEAKAAGRNCNRIEATPDRAPSGRVTGPTVA